MIALAIALELIGLAPSDDARTVTAIGPQGQIYEPDGRGWVRKQPITIAANVETIERGSAIVVGGGGAVYKLAANDGWTAIRLAQKGRAIGGTGARAVAALGRDVFDLDKPGENKKVASAQGTVSALAGGANTVVVRTDRGLFRIDKSGQHAIPRVPASARLLGDRWAITDDAAWDLRSNRSIKLPRTDAAAQTADGKLVATGMRQGTRILFVVDAKVAEEPLAGLTVPAVGIVMDKAARVAIALRDGTIALRDHGAWATSAARDELPAAKPGSGPALSGVP